MLNSHSITQFRINQAPSPLQSPNKNQNPTPIAQQEPEPHSIKQTEPARHTTAPKAAHSNIRRQYLSATSDANALQSPNSPSKTLKHCKQKAQHRTEAPSRQISKLSTTPKPRPPQIRGNCESRPQTIHCKIRGNCESIPQYIFTADSWQLRKQTTSYTLQNSWQLQTSIPQIPDRGKPVLRKLRWGKPRSRF